MTDRTILYIITTGESGGAQTHLYDLCTHLPTRYKPLAAMGTRGILADKLEKDGIEVHIIPALKREISFKHDFKAYQEIRQLIKQLKPDLVCTHSSKAGFLGRLAAWRLGLPTVFTAHGWAFTEGVPARRQGLYKMLERLAAGWTSRIICVSDYDFRLAVGNRVASADKMVIIHNGIPAAPEKVNQTVTTDRPVRLIMVARFSLPKDQPLLLKAISQLRTEIPIEAWLVGEGPLLETVRDYATRLNVSDKIKFWGNRSDVADLLPQADIFVLTSHWEGFPITILEAMRAGLPVIASDVGGCREAIEDSLTGYLVQPGDVRGLSDCLRTLIEDRELRLRMGEAGRERFSRIFTVDKMAVRTVKVYDEVMAAFANER